MKNYVIKNITAVYQLWNQKVQSWGGGYTLQDIGLPNASALQSTLEQIKNDIRRNPDFDKRIRSAVKIIDIALVMIDHGDGFLGTLGSGSSLKPNTNYLRDFFNDNDKFDTYRYFICPTCLNFARQRRGDKWSGKSQALTCGCPDVNHKGFKMNPIIMGLVSMVIYEYVSTTSEGRDVIVKESFDNAPPENPVIENPEEVLLEVLRKKRAEIKHREEAARKLKEQKEKEERIKARKRMEKVWENKELMEQNIRDYLNDFSFTELARIDGVISEIQSDHLRIKSTEHFLSFFPEMQFLEEKKDETIDYYDTPIGEIEQLKNIINEFENSWKKLDDMEIYYLFNQQRLSVNPYFRKAFILRYMNLSEIKHPKLFEEVSSSVDKLTDKPLGVLEDLIKQGIKARTSPVEKEEILELTSPEELPKKLQELKEIDNKLANNHEKIMEHSYSVTKDVFLKLTNLDLLAEADKIHKLLILLEKGENVIPLLIESGLDVMIDILKLKLLETIKTAGEAVILLDYLKESAELQLRKSFLQEELQNVIIAL